MCGVVAIAGRPQATSSVEKMIAVLRHRGPDGRGIYTDATDSIALGHTRLSIIDRSDAGAQPMTSADGRFVLVFNGELYNHVELRAELTEYPFRSRSDTEVVLAAWARWGAECLPRMNGMFAFVMYDTRERRLFAVRDRFGVKPMLFARLPDGGIALASEIKALQAGGRGRDIDAHAWATYLVHGLSDHSARTFWSGIERLAAGTILTWSAEQGIESRRWYDLVERTSEIDQRDEAVVRDEYLALLVDSVRLRFRSDVPVGINLSGGVDSSTLLALVHAVRGADSDVEVFSFVTGDPSYDELPWITQMLDGSQHPLRLATLSADEVPALADSVANAVDEPYGGVPTLAYAKLFKLARERGVIVLLDGQGIDEQWAGYDYYRAPSVDPNQVRVQGSSERPVRPECLAPDFVEIAQSFSPPRRAGDRLRDMQYADFDHNKLPRALRFNDRISMTASTELREPFLDYRLVELAIRQPADRKIRNGTGKWLLRELTRTLTPTEVRNAPKRPVQTPQREWLRGPLRAWATDRIELALRTRPDWFSAKAARDAWEQFAAGRGDNSFWIWQWLSVGWATGGSS
jgi:asparagine synthase (glutamine-hydrolysing)